MIFLQAGSSSVRTSRRQSDSEPCAPNPKRQKVCSYVAA